MISPPLCLFLGSYQITEGRTPLIIDPFGYKTEGSNRISTSAMYKNSGLNGGFLSVGHTRLRTQ